MNKISQLQCVLLVLTLVAGMSATHAANKRFNFNGGNSEGFNKVDNSPGAWNIGLPVEYRSAYATGLGWGALNMRSEIIQTGKRVRGGGYWLPWGYKKATVESRVRMNGQGSNAWLNWGAWWVWNDKKNGQLLEIDMMETIPAGNQFNHYWYWGNNQAQGRKSTRPNSKTWRSNWQNYKARYTSGTNVEFWLNNGKYYKSSNGGNRGNELAKLKYNNRPFTFRVKSSNISARRMPDLNVDWAQVWY